MNFLLTDDRLRIWWVLGWRISRVFFGWALCLWIECLGCVMLYNKYICDVCHYYYVLEHSGSGFWSWPENYIYYDCDGHCDALCALIFCTQIKRPRPWVHAQYTHYTHTLGDRRDQSWRWSRRDITSFSIFWANHGHMRVAWNCSQLKDAQNPLSSKGTTDEHWKKKVRPEAVQYYGILSHTRLG